MKHATSKQVYAREQAILPFLRAVHRQVELWARSSTNGALVWEVANDDLPSLWEIWAYVQDQDRWYLGSKVCDALDAVSLTTDCSEVRATVDAAKRAINEYHEVETA